MMLIYKYEFRPDITDLIPNFLGGSDAFDDETAIKLTARYNRMFKHAYYWVVPVFEAIP